HRNALPQTDRGRARTAGQAAGSYSTASWPQPSTTQNYALTGTDSTGKGRASTVAYDKPSAEHRKAELEAAGATDVKVVPIRPGELPQP
ncbi:hypothetical protein, partial [Kitasatospora aureofaciens]|uniref:hypothetical protein n=1 Tax=Kitasatospora aureofaciens TaxID=1894 RepID=UPI0005258906